eukprot:9554859-Alexandrium_andersonii.AAC.1
MPKRARLLGARPTLAELCRPRPQRSRRASGSENSGRCFRWRDGDRVAGGRGWSSLAACADALAMAE